MRSLLTAPEEWPGNSSEDPALIILVYESIERNKTKTTTMKTGCQAIKELDGCLWKGREFQWLGLHPSTAWGMGLISGWGTKTPHVKKQKKKKKKRKKKGRAVKAALGRVRLS